MGSKKNSKYVAKFDTNFFERYARLTLVEKVSANYAALFNADRPDLQSPDNKMGIEVTRAMVEDKTIAKALIDEMAGKRLSASEQMEVDAMESQQSGYAFGLSDLWIGEREYDYWNLALPMKRIVASKVDKVAKGFYGEFDKFGLYIFTMEKLTDVDVEALIHYTIDLQRHNERHYDVLFVSLIHKLVVCDLTCGEYHSYEITRQESRDFYRKALYNIE